MGINVDKILFSSLGNKIMCSGELLKEKRYAHIMNKYAMGALSNYAKAKDVDVYLSSTGRNLFDDVRITVFGKGSVSNKSESAIRLDEDPRNFAEAMRTIYKSVENGIKTLKQD